MATQSQDDERDRTDGRRRRTDQERTGLRGGRGRRILAGVLGGVLLVRGLRRRGLRGAATALVGGWLLARALGRGVGIDRARDAATETATTLGRSRAGGATEVTRSITIGKPAEDLYETWRDPDQLSRVVGHFAEVTAPDEDRLEWTVHGPGGRDLSWETRIVEDEPGELLRWETPPDATVPNEGSIHFDRAAGDRGTIVTLSMTFDPPGGTVGQAALQRLDVVPAALLGTALDRFKSLAETGEIPTLTGNPSARGSGDLL